MGALANVTHIDSVRKTSGKKPQAATRIRRQAPSQEPALGNKDWTIWFANKHFDQLVRRTSDDKIVANDSSIWAQLLADSMSIGWFHDDLYGLRDRQDPIFAPLRIEKTVTEIANLLRESGIRTIESITVAQRVETALHMILPRPANGDCLDWDRDHWNRHQGIAFTNGVLDLETLTLRPLDVDDRATWRIPYRWMGGTGITMSQAQFWMTTSRICSGMNRKAR